MNKMTQLQLSFLACLMFVMPWAKCSDLGKDGFNFYKDYLRARSEDNTQDSLPDRMLYFYRTPIQLSSIFMPNIEQEYKKRTRNAFKDHMLNKELSIGEIPKKRMKKSSLSFMLLTSKPYHIGKDILEDEMEASVSKN